MVPRCVGGWGLKRRSEARVVGWQRRTEPPHGTGIRNTGNSRGPGSRGGGGLSAEGGCNEGWRWQRAGGRAGEGNEPRQLISPGFHNALANERPL